MNHRAASAAPWPAQLRPRGPAPASGPLLRRCGAVVGVRRPPPRCRAIVSSTNSNSIGAPEGPAGADGGRAAGGWPSTFLSAIGRLAHRGPPAPPQPKAAPAPPPPPPVAAPACPIECLPGTPVEVIRALAPQRVSSAAAAVGSALRSSGAAHGAAGLRHAAVKLHAELSPAAWDSFVNEVEAAALRAALQHPAPAMMTLNSLASWQEEDEEAVTGAAAGAAASGLDLAIGQPAAWVPPAAAAAAARADPADWGAFLRAGVGGAATAAPPSAPAAAGPHGGAARVPSPPSPQLQPPSLTPQPPTMVGAHRITVLPAFGSAPPAAEAPPAATAGPAASDAAAAAAAAAGPRRGRGTRKPRRRDPAPHFSHLVFGGGGARVLAYAGALHTLRTLGLVRRVESVAGASGGAIMAVLAALGLGPQDILSAMSHLPDAEAMNWLGMRSNLGLTSGADLFAAIERAVARRTGVQEPTLGDIQASTGVRVFIATTSLAKRAPLYLDSRTHAGMLVRDALRASAAIPFYLEPLRSPFDANDLLVDGCLTDCTPVGALMGACRDCGAPVDPAAVLVLAVHDAAGGGGGGGAAAAAPAGGGVAPDLNGLLNGLVATALQAGFHHTLASGVTVINLFEAVNAVDPLQFRMSAAQGREVVARAQALTERWAVDLCSHRGGGGSPAGTPADASTDDAVAAPRAADGGVAAAAPPPAEPGVVPAEAGSKGRNALMASMGGGGGGGGIYTDAAGHDLAFGCDIHPWWLASVDEASGDGGGGGGGRLAGLGLG